MMYKFTYHSPLGEMTLLDDDGSLAGAWFLEQKHYGAGMGEAPAGETPVLALAVAWLDSYFAGNNPYMELPLSPRGTAYQKVVWNALLTIPYGTTMSYGAVARLLSSKGHNASARAVGCAVGKNPVSIFIPCHRVLASTGDLAGYAGGIKRKKALLDLEQKRLHAPQQK